MQDKKCLIRHAVDAKSETGCHFTEHFIVCSDYTGLDCYLKTTGNNCKLVSFYFIKKCKIEIVPSKKITFYPLEIIQSCKTYID